MNLGGALWFILYKINDIIIIFTINYKDLNIYDQAASGFFY